jgi:hypothetical protein
VLIEKLAGAISMDDAFEIKAVTLAELRSDNNGRLISEIAGVME